MDKDRTWTDQMKSSLEGTTVPRDRIVLCSVQESISDESVKVTCEVHDKTPTVELVSFYLLCLC